MESLYQKMKWVLFIVVIIIISQSLTNFIFGDVKALNNTESLSNSTNSSITNSSMNLNETNANATMNGIKHVIITVMENKGYTQIIGSSDAPYQNELAKKYASASKYYGVFPDSLPNYIAIISGYPYRCKNTVNLDNFYKDLNSNSLPNYSFVVPNNIHDSHDSTVADGDKWLSTFVPKIINSTTFNSTALFIVYDEGQKHDKSGFGIGQYAVTGGRLPIILVSPYANNGFVSKLNIAITIYFLHLKKSLI